MITSSKNPTIQHIRKLQSKASYRREKSLFIIEGIRLAGECVAAGIKPETVLFTENAGSDLIAKFEAMGVEPIEVPETVMRAAGDTQTPQGILAVVPQSILPLPDNISFAVILDGVRDPGNVGTILRTASAAGVDAVLLAPGCADPFAPKVVRAGMGAHFQVPVRMASWDEIRSFSAGLDMYLADAKGKQVYTDVDFQKRLGLVIGGEAYGADASIDALNPSGIRIPMPGGAESLNAAIAAGILIFELVRQRNTAG